MPTQDHTDPHTLADLIAESLIQLSAALDAEHAVRGLDALDERTIQHHIASTLKIVHSLGVQTEHPYPAQWEKLHPPHPPLLSHPLPLPRDRWRCDLAITPSPAITITDPHAEALAYETSRNQAVGTLFANLAHAQPTNPNPPSPPPTTIPPEQAFWIELKVIGQHHITDGIASPNYTYASTLAKGPADDAAKLAKDPRIHHAAALVLLFTETEPTARNDLTRLAHRCLDRNLPVSMPITRTFLITDRIGNTAATLCLIPIQTTYHDDTDDDFNDDFDDDINENTNDIN